MAHGKLGDIPPIKGFGNERSVQEIRTEPQMSSSLELSPHKKTIFIMIKCCSVYKNLKDLSLVLLHSTSRTTAISK